VFCIGQGLEHYAQALGQRGWRVEGFDALQKALPRLSEAAALVLSQDSTEVGVREFFSASRGVPKVLLCSNSSFKGLGQWLREPLTYCLYSPTAGQLHQLLKRLMVESKFLKEHRLLKEENHAMRRELAFHAALNKAIATGAGHAEVLQMVIEEILRRTKASTYNLYLLEEESGNLVVEMSSGSLKRPKRHEIKAGEEVAGWVAREGKVVLIKDIYREERFLQMLDRELRHKTRSLLAVPVRSKGKCLGVIELVNKQGDEAFGQADLAALQGLVGHLALVIERATMYEKMQELVITDDLTKLFNTRYMNRTLETEVLRCERYKTSLSLIFLDVDYFKSINDNHGHLVGSKVLVEMAQLLIRHLRDVDIVARYGGDEFVIILPQTPPQYAVQIAERLRKLIEQHVFLRKEGLNLKLTASFGVASYPDSAKSKEDLLRLADEAMYRVKHKSRNGVYAII